MKPSALLEIFLRFLGLGCISFGGPAAHIGYFRNYFVEKHRWLDEQHYAGLVALSQFLPGPGSSQVGFAIGMNRAGIPGGIAAFLGFTLPSFVLLYLVATSTAQFSDSNIMQGVIHGLKLLAVVVVADATYGMFNNFCKQRWSLCVATATAMALLILPGIGTQLIVLLAAAAIGSLLGKTNTQASLPLKKPGLISGGLFAMMALLPLLLLEQPLIALFHDFFAAGSLVFGGGHVVLPLLQDLVGDSMSTDRFLLGYAAAQAVPGPMFTLASFLGAELYVDMPLMGAILATLAVFLPGFLLLIAFHDSWQSLNSRPRIAAGIQGINAAVVGLLLAALYQPVFSSAVSSGTDFALILVGLLLLRGLKLSIMLLVGFFIATGAFIL